LINLDDIKGNYALTLLENYNGLNPYLIKMKKDYFNNKTKLTDTQIKYISDNHEKEPILINRIIRITPFLGEELKKQDNISFIPEKILIEYILAENEKTYHIYGKLKKNQKESKMYWLPKTQVIDDPYYEEVNVDVDFNKYNSILAKYGKKLYQHQEESVKFLLSRNSSILALDMGLGKSMISIIAALESEAKNILVVCPSSVKINWKREINTFSNNVTIIEGRKWDKAKFTIINYDILKNFHTIGNQKKKNNTDSVDYNRQIVDSNFDLIIVDEAHYLKNNKSIRGEIIADLVINHGINKIWLLTGTPISNRPMDFFNLLKIIKSPLAQNWQYYAIRYCDARKMFRTLKNGNKKQIWITDGASNLDELASKTKNLILRKLKTDVLDMPDKVTIPVYHELSKKGWGEYNRLWDEYLEKRREEKKRGPIQRDLVELILLRKFIAMEAIPQTIEMTENAIEMDKKVVIFTSFTDELLELSDYFGKNAVLHYGPMSDKEKQRSVDEFQNNDKIKVFIGNIKSAGVGITLTKATVVIFNSFEWVPSWNEQGEDRCVFEGQLIMTDSGYKKIEDIQIGDKVYTHLGNFKKVINIHTHLEIKKTRIDINSFGFNEKLSLTEDHKVFVYNTEKKHFEWVEAINLNIFKHKLTLKLNKQRINEKEYLEVDDYILYPIKNINISQAKKGEERVYDLSVEDDNSFVVGGYNVHNCYRIGQNEDVNVYYQLFEDTISVRMWETLRNKKEVISTIMGDKKLSDEEITQIMTNKLIENYE
jgi:SWI/SNF-related matrix-associated actin-dependent regulator 1 of chromatin subfamily A